MPKKLPIFYSALLLTGVNLLLRMAGTSFQVYLSGRIGAEGVGLLQLVLSVGSMALVAGMAGIRTATMYLTAEEIGKKQKENLRWVLSGAIQYSLFFSCLVALAVYLFAPQLALHWIGNEKTVDSLRLVAFFLPVNCLTGVMVGYFTGAGRIGTLAIVEVAEQIVSMAATMLLLTFWAGGDAEKACISCLLGSGLGACLTLSCLSILRILERSHSGKPILLASRLANTALPLAIADDLRTGITTVENLMVPKRLALYRGSLSPLAAFGTVCGMVFPILMFPAAILFGLTELLIPELARCHAAGSQKRISHLVRKSLQVAMLYGSACSGILILCGRQLGLSLYHSEAAGQYLLWFAPLAVMLYCDAVIDAMIKGLGQQKISVRYNIITNILDVALLFILLPRLGIFGYFLSFTVTHFLNFGLSIRRLLKITGEKIPLRTPLVTIASTGFAVWVCAHISGSVLRSGGFLVILFCLLYLSKIIGKDDIRWIKGLIYKK